MKNLYLLLILYFSLSLYTSGQSLPQFKLRHDVPVITPAGTLAMPWSGGLNTPQFSAIDLNKDGREDLFIFDRTQRKVFTYLAVQVAGSWKYTYKPEYEVYFPENLEAWVLLRDYNCDGLKDIFTSSPLGIRVYRQEAAQGEPKFILAEDALYYNANRVNMQMGSADIPAITDMDNDGDLDILITEFSRGVTMEYYRNMRIEQGLGCNTLSFVQDTDWWGKITECEGCDSYLFGAYCRIAAPLHTGHSGTALLTIDLDDDGDKDLLMGNVECNNLIKMENKGSSTSALMAGFEKAFPANTTPAKFNLFPAAYYEDVTFDGVPDMVVAPNSAHHDGEVEMQRSVWLYRNKGTASKPDFEYVQNDFLQGQLLDLGEGAFPAFTDMDADGDYDLLVGNLASFRNGVYTSSISYFENTGTATNPAFKLITDDYLNLAGRQLLSIIPAFADINNDGAPDLILTYKEKLNGSKTYTNASYYILNKAAKNQPARYNLADLKSNTILTNGYAPAFVDVDGDGDMDYLLGKTTGELVLYRNTGTASNPTYAAEKTALGGIAGSTDRRNLYPTIADVDGDSKPDLLTTDDSGSLHIYRNFTQDLNSNFTADKELLENDLTSTVQATRFGKGLSIAAAPLGGDGKMYLAVGTQGGGLYLLEQTAGNNAYPTEPLGKLTLQLYPNPGIKTTHETILIKASDAVSLEVFDAIGRRIYSTENKYNLTHRLPLSLFKAGMYVVRATSRTEKQASAKFIVQ
ncbi:T9SS type A sorting domain-containing protein [Pontibacter vulgaris]|uniref:T9SS type A sorting domain-containing protein n=1 Tax=Pontibacter vulgaris TaxID=2905679 RepID=UPI001FA7FC66|nr:T9SS type A sorting domain-containing protein [Pontibacter vulgaris]